MIKEIKKDMKIRYYGNFLNHIEQCKVENNLYKFGQDDYWVRLDYTQKFLTDNHSKAKADSDYMYSLVVGAEADAFMKLRPTLLELIQGEQNSFYDFLVERNVDFMAGWISYRQNYSLEIMNCIHMDMRWLRELAEHVEKESIPLKKNKKIIL